jgi:colanic acid/amylovoran biosynthesis glycosyltransferase
VRIAVLTGLFPVLWETPFLNQITGLLELGHEVDVYADQPQPGVPEHPDVGRFGLLARTRYPVRLSGSRLSRWAQALRLIQAHRGADRSALLRTLNPLSFWARAWSLDQLRRTAPFLPRRTYDVCYCPFAQDARRFLRLRKLGVLGGKLVVALRGSDFSRYLHQRGKQVYRSVVREGDLFLPVCEAFAVRLRRLGCEPGKVVVHHTGITLSRFPYRPRPRPDGTLRLITIGRLVEKKGITYALEAVRQLSDAGLDVSYEVLGDGPLKHQLEHQVRHLGLGSRVRFSGWQAHDKVQEALVRADVLVAPCVTAADGDEEGIPNVLREAMATGRPVIATFHSGIPELIEDGRTGLLVQERNSTALTSRVRRLAEQPEMWEPMVAAARRRVEEDDINRLNRRLVVLLEQLVGAAHDIPSSLRVPAPA